MTEERRLEILGCLELAHCAISNVVNGEHTGVEEAKLYIEEAIQLLMEEV